MTPTRFRLHGLWCVPVIRGRIADTGFCDLARMGWVERSNTTNDGRCHYRLTDEGRARADKAFGRNQR